MAAPHGSAGHQDRTWLLLAITLLALLTLVGIHTRPLTPIDETRYIGVAWEMWLRGEFLVPIKNGLPYSDKPPLLMWLYQAGWTLFGVNEWWPRLVSPLFSAASLLLAWGLARRLWPAQSGVGGTTALVLSSCLLWIAFSTSAMFDVLLAFFTLLGMHGTLSAAQGDRKGFLLLGLAIGLGVLAKGPVILLHTLPVALLAFWWQPALTRHRWLAGVALAALFGAAIALAWAIPAGLSGGESYRHAIFWGQTAERMVQSFAHRRPFWWYLPTLPFLLFPWLLWPAVWRGSRQLLREGLDPGTRFCLAWLVPVLVALSLISGKQVHYLIPLFPAFALLVARALAGRTLAGVSWLPAAAAALGLALAVLALGWVPLPKKGLAAAPSLVPALALLALAPATWFLARRRVASVPRLAVFGSLLAALLQLSLSAAFRADFDIAPLADAIRQEQAAGRVVANSGFYHDQFQFAGRLRQPLAEFTDEARLVEWLKANPGASTVLYWKDANALAAEPAIPRQGYRGGVAALVDAPTALRLLGAHADTAAPYPIAEVHPKKPEEAQATP
ncbi:glycosyltransferase family 39 protein [Pseudomonas sp. LFM046]|uniref:ArnT family glycosyltransferase n=1 Tax=Pseudomonas sp. LFM046 TaxID=1608357 RepID=UPI000CCC9045|nr:glycosyltransferase family 39 protein [Pseudomonas sp. LFM046]